MLISYIRPFCCLNWYSNPRLLMPSMSTLPMPRLHNRTSGPQIFYSKPKVLITPDAKYAPPVLCTEDYMRPPLSTMSNRTSSNAIVERKRSRAVQNVSATAIDYKPSSKPDDYPVPPTLADILRMEPELSPWSALERASDVPPFGVTGRVEGKWTQGTSGSKECLKNDYCPLPPTLADIRRMEPEMSPRSALQRASDVPPSLLRTLLHSLNQPQTVEKACNSRKRKVQTPFLHHYDDRTQSARVLEGATGASRKRARISTDTSAFPARARVPLAWRQREKYRPLVEWLTGAIYDIVVVPSKMKQQCVFCSSLRVLMLTSSIESSTKTRDRVLQPRSSTS